MPMTGPDDISVTTRTPHIRLGAELAAAIKGLREAAGDRGAGLDIAAAYQEPSLSDPATDVGRHRAAFDDLEQSGVNWLVIPGVGRTRDESVSFIARFGRDFCGR
jgi:hypothetical protein